MPALRSANRTFPAIRFFSVKPLAATSRSTQLQIRAFSVMPRSTGANLFDYTSGRWLYNDALRHAERRRVFNVEGLCQLAAQSVHRHPDSVAHLEKLAEGGSNRTFLLTFRDGFQMVVRVPYPVTVPKYFALASEAATMALLRSSGLPVPQIYGYAPTADNAAETEYIFMEYVQGIKLSSIWFELGEKDIDSVTHQLAQLESKMMSIAFPAGGSLYYAKDLSRRTSIPLNDEGHFCIGPDTRFSLWFGRRAQLDVDRGPYRDAESALSRPVEKELAYLEKSGRPLLPFQRVRREAYKYQAQSPSDHIENLRRYLLIAPSLVPRGPALTRFCIRHPDLQPGNIIVSRSADSRLNIIGLLDWQHASILPTFLLPGIPESFQNYDDPVSRSLTLPSLPENFDVLEEEEKSEESELYRRRLVHHHYVKATAEHNAPLYAASTDPMCILRHRLFTHAGSPWDGETVFLKLALMDAAENWEALTGGRASCPLVFDPKDVLETRKLNDVLSQNSDTLESLESFIGSGPEGWVPTSRFEESMARNQQLKENALEVAETDADRKEIASHWPFDDIDEEVYL